MDTRGEAEAQKVRRDHVVGTFYILASALCFGSMAIFARMAYASGVDIPTLLLLRFSIASVLMWGVLFSKGMKLPGGRGLALLVAMGAVGYAGQAFSYFSALTYASAGLVALLLYTYPAIVALLSRLVFKHPFTGTQITALAVALAGTVFIIGKAGDGKPLGIFFGLLAALIYSVYILAGSRFPKEVTPTASTAVITSSAALTYAAVVAVKGFHPPATGQGWVAVLAIAVICTVLAILFFFEGLERVGPVRASVFSTVEPVFTVLLAAAVLGEKVTLTRALGGALIVGAVVLLARESVLAASARLE
ncbi:MAG: DMT family transporter [Geothrix sp.]|nr:DMT family transporter [Geothrix sp.]